MSLRNAKAVSLKNNINKKLVSFDQYYTEGKTTFTGKVQLKFKKE